MAPTTVLFAISDTGGGHRSAAVALSAALTQTSYPGMTCNIVDVLQATNVPVVRNSHTLYDDLSTRWLSLYNAAFRLTDGVGRVEMISRLVDLRARPHVASTLSHMAPQLVVVTHPLAQRFVGTARRQYELPCGVVTVVTDLVTLHSSWTYAGVDLCIVPTDESYALMRRRGMPADLMVRTGFPVHPKFVHYSRSRDESRHDLGLAAAPFTILLTNGGVGSGHMQQLVPTLEQAFPQHQLLVITGRNKVLQQQLEAEPRGPLTRVYGFVNNMEALMAASDIVVAKAGPGTLMEALVMRRPVIVTEAVGMQEHGNIDFVLNHRLGFFCPTSAQVVAAVEQLSDAGCYAATAANLADAVPRDGAETIASILLERLQQGGRPSSQRRRLKPHRPWRRIWRRSARHVQPSE